MPKHDQTYDWYVRAYSILRFSRRGSGYIPLSEILSYVSHFELIGTKFEFISIIQSLDFTEKDFFEKKEKAQLDKSNVKSNTNVRL